MSAFDDIPGPLVLLGAGRMGTAMLVGWLAAGLDPAKIVVLDPYPSAQARELIARHDIAHNPPPRLSDKGLLVVAVKPQMMDAALKPLAGAGGGGSLIISIAAGITLGYFAQVFGAATPVIRAMPNTPAAIGKGITAFVGNGQVTEAQRGTAHTLLAPLGEVVEVADEALMDAVTATSGSGPAYVFLLAECLAAAGAAQGLPPELAAKLARATVAGAGALLEQAEDTPVGLREAVTSPGGTTEAALRVLMAENDGLCDLMTGAVAAATRRSRELSGE